MGFDFHKFVFILKTVGPAVLAVSGVPPVLVPVILHGIELAESQPQSGAEKKAIALDAVQTGIAAVNAVKPGSLDSGLTSLVSEGIDVTVGVVNAIHNRAKP